MGLIISVLAPIVLFLLGILTVLQTIAGILLLSGLWAVAYGLIFAKLSGRLYNVGAGVIVVALSTFVFLPLQYVLALVLIVVMALAVTSITVDRNRV